MMQEVDEGLLTTALMAPSRENRTNTAMPANIKRATFLNGCVAAAIVLAANCMIGVVLRAGRKTTTPTHRDGFSAMYGHRHLRFSSDLILDKKGLSLLSKDLIHDATADDFDTAEAADADGKPDFSVGTESLQRQYVNARREFSDKTKCTNLNLEPGTVTVLEAPEFHCGSEILKHLLLDHRDERHQKWGVKLIHLVCNPFSMAVSNYHYHGQHDTPEKFVHTSNPCDTFVKTIGASGETIVDLSEPLLSQAGIMDRGSFDQLALRCHELYQKRPGLETGSYYDHLQRLPSGDGIELATIDKFKSFALMANDLILFDEVQSMVEEAAELNQGYPTRHRSFELYTMSLDDWIENPSGSMHRFLDFAIGSHMSPGKKHEVANIYERHYIDVQMPTKHVTSGKYDDKPELMSYLRQHPLLGGPLARMEQLVNGRLAYEFESIPLVGDQCCIVSPGLGSPGAVRYGGSSDNTSGRSTPSGRDTTHPSSLHIIPEAA
ncbi:hypothetical protein THAOC_33007 [Thalassiosira oceanica]|uniref:Sulfotransferase domain-containing protein n=1 Tax=Thalassiosira oceanica TaxID=159749 RepID=K0RH61_THAOC|nr:hypothetical protein THAOC_33007 [Thalassiosira oceanica]|eukprot:EJK48216.1 hypothetical protein THAOC_33007 [Thalassiosira oceanica]